MADEHDQAEREAQEGVDRAYRALVAIRHPGAIVVGWSGVAEFVMPATESQSSTLRTVSARGQLVTTTIGHHVLALGYHKGTLSGEADSS